MANKNWHQKAQEQLSRSDRIALGINNTVGSMKFVVISTIIIFGWLTLNGFALVKHWDAYPFILLNLMFSMFAFYASPLILMAGNIAANRDKVQAEHQQKHQEDELLANTKLTTEVHTLTKQIHEHLGIKPKD